MNNFCEITPHVDVNPSKILARGNVRVECVAWEHNTCYLALCIKIPPHLTIRHFKVNAVPEKNVFL